MFKKLFSANLARIGRFNGTPTSDPIPASLVDGTPSDLKADLIALPAGQLADEVECPTWHNLLRDCLRPRAIASRAGRLSEAKGWC